MTDGKVITSFMEEMLCSYAAYSEGNVYVPEIKDCDDANAEPFEVAKKVFEERKLPKVDAKGGGLMDKTPFVIQKGFEDEDIKPCHYLIRADAREYMKYAKECGVRPAALLAALYAGTVNKVMGPQDRKMKAAIPVDFRDALGIPNTFRNCALPPVMIDIEPELAQDILNYVNTNIGYDTVT